MGDKEGPVGNKMGCDEKSKSQPGCRNKPGRDLTAALTWTTVGCGPQVTCRTGYVDSHCLIRKRVAQIGPGGKGRGSTENRSARMKPGQVMQR